MREIELNDIEDLTVRNNFEVIQDGFREQPILKGKWKFFEISFDGVVTNEKYPHNLGFQPKDILQTSTTGVGDITFNYSSFDKENLDITTSGACTVRAFIGTYEEGE